MGFSSKCPLRLPITLGVCFFIAIAGFFLWTEHRAHALGVLPYLLLAACPIIHLFMHGGHGGHQEDHAGHRRQSGTQEDGDRS